MKNSNAEVVFFDNEFEKCRTLNNSDILMLRDDSQLDLPNKTTGFIFDCEYEMRNSSDKLFYSVIVLHGKVLSPEQIRENKSKYNLIMNTEVTDENISKIDEFYVPYLGLEKENSFLALAADPDFSVDLVANNKKELNFYMLEIAKGYQQAVNELTKGKEKIKK